MASRAGQVNAAELTAALRPRLTIPHHYAFTGGMMGDRLIIKGDRDPDHFVAAVRQLAADCAVQVVPPGQPIELSP